MWDAQTKIVDRIGLPDGKRILLDKVLSLCDVPVTGVVIILDDNDYEDYVNHTWRGQGVHFNIQHGGIERMSPGHLLSIMELREYQNFIWLSRKVSYKDDIDFAWIIAHELGHLKQDRMSNILSQAGYFLYSSLGFINIDEPNINIIVPTELDAELTAWRITCYIFGIETVDSYVISNTLCGDRQKCFQYLRQYNPEKSYDVVAETYSMLRKYQTQLEEYQKRTTDKIVKKFLLDIVCQELEKIMTSNSA